MDSDSVLFLIGIVIIGVILLGRWVFAGDDTTDTTDNSTGPMSQADVDQFVLYDAGVDPKDFTPYNSAGEVLFREIGKG